MSKSKKIYNEYALEILGQVGNAKLEGAKLLVKNLLEKPVILGLLPRILRAILELIELHIEETKHELYTLGDLKSIKDNNKKYLSLRTHYNTTEIKEYIYNAKLDWFCEKCGHSKDTHTKNNSFANHDWVPKEGYAIATALESFLK